MQSTCFFLQILLKAFSCLSPTFNYCWFQILISYFSQACLDIKGLKIRKKKTFKMVVLFMSFFITIMGIIWPNTKNVIFCLPGIIKIPVFSFLPLPSQSSSKKNQVEVIYSFFFLLIQLQNSFYSICT